MKTQKVLISLLEDFRTLDPFQLCQRLKIEVRYVDISKKVLGQFVHVLGRPFILLNERIHNEPVRYFVAARELYRALKYTDYNETQCLKTSGPEFSKRLLNCLYIEEHPRSSTPTADELHRLYGVPKD